MDNKISNLIIDAEKLYFKGAFDESLSIINSIKDQNYLSVENNISCCILQANCLFSKGEYNSCLEIINNCLKIINETFFNEFIKLNIIKVSVLWKLGKLSDAIDLIDFLISKINQTTKLESKTSVQHKADLLNWLGLVFLDQGKQDGSLETFEKSLILCKEINDKILISRIYNNFGIVYGQKGDLDKSLENFLESLEYKKEIGTKEDIAGAFNNIGIVYRMKGELNQALDYYQQSLIIRNDIGNKIDIAGSLNNIGVIYSLKGEVNQALEYHQRSLKLRTAIGNKIDISTSFNNLGIIYRTKGELIRAEDYFNKNLQISEEIGNPLTISKALMDLFVISIESKLKENANQIMKKLEIISEKEENFIISTRFKVAQALYLKLSLRSKHRGKAEEILENILSQDSLNLEIKEIVLINLCEILFIELKLTELPEILDELKGHVNYLLEIAKKQDSSILLVQSYVLLAKLNLLENYSNKGIQKSNELLIKALNIAEKKDIIRLQYLINEEIQILEKIKKGIETGKKTLSYAEKIEITQLYSLISSMRRKSLDIQKKAEVFSDNDLKNLQIGLCIGSLTNIGLEVLIKSKSCLIEDHSLKTHLEYTGVLYQDFNKNQIFGPFPNVKQGKNLYFLSYGFKIIDDTYSDSRIKKDDNRVPAIILLFYPKKFDVLLSILKPNLGDILSKSVETWTNIISINKYEINQLEDDILKLLNKKVRELTIPSSN